MKKWYNILEIVVDKLVPYCLVILFFLILFQLTAPEIIEPYHLYVEIADWTIIGIFVVDLIFKYLRVRNVKNFLKRYWIEIIAIFPAFLVVRVVEEFAIVANLDETIALSQESLDVGERSGARAARSTYFQRFIAPLARIPRFFKAFSFYERPHHHFGNMKF